MDNVPHLLKLSNEALLDSKVKSTSFSVSSSHEQINKSPSNNKSNASPVFVKDGLLQHSLHQSTRTSSYNDLVGYAFTDSDSSFDSASSDETMSCDEMSSTSGSSHSTSITTTGRVGSIVVRSKKRRKCSREQRKFLMQHMHMARCKKEKVHAGMK